MGLRFESVKLFVAFAIALAALTQPVLARDDDPALNELLRKSAEYVANFEQSFSQILGAESYHQELRDSGGRVARRQLESEIFFTGLDDEGVWLTVRNILKVDGRTIRDSKDRIDRAFRGEAKGLRGRLRLLADEGARFNLGAIGRNFNDPMLALVFLDPHYQPRFHFSLDGSETIGGSRVYRVAFEERRRPTIIRGSVEGKDLPASGTLFVTAEGQVLRSELIVGGEREVVSRLTVSFQRDARLDMLVPAIMEERYEDTGRSRTLLISCSAVYSNFRRFETSSRLVTPQTP